ncbi:MAG: hypothetical protein Q4G40_06870 [Brachybacterium sp.]|nr:hypothetical protein [Brachybacterium sp.]
MQIFLWIIAGALLANVVVALIVISRRPGHNRWLLGALLTGTTGAGVAAVLAALSGDDGTGARMLDVALVLVALAAVSTTVRAAQRYERDDAVDPDSRAQGGV